MQHRLLYFGILAGLMLLFLASLGSGLWGQPADYSSWPYRFFHGICHQITERSYSLNEVPMAVNTRCFGIFTGLLSGWLALPIAMKKLHGKKWPKIALIFAVMIQIIDYTGGFLHIWSSSNNLRFLMGAILGITVVMVLADQFFNPTDNQTI